MYLGGGHFLRRAVIGDRDGGKLRRQQLPGDGGHALRCSLTHRAQHHVRRRVKRTVAGVERLGRDLRDALDRTGYGVARAVARHQAAHQVAPYGAVGVVVPHTDLLRDDALLLGHARIGEIRRRDKAQQRAQVLLKVVRAGKIVCRHVGRREGVRAGAVAAEGCQRVRAVGHVEEFVLKIVRDAGGRVRPRIAHAKAPVGSAVAGRKYGVAALKVGLAEYAHAQAVRQRRRPDIFGSFICHRQPPPFP